MGQIIQHETYFEKTSAQSNVCIMSFFFLQVEWFMQQKEKKYKLHSQHFSDPLFRDQWYIVSYPQVSYHYNDNNCWTNVEHN